jgi:hypothetical protein
MRQWLICSADITLDYGFYLKKFDIKHIFLELPVLPT